MASVAEAAAPATVASPEPMAIALAAEALAPATPVASDDPKAIAPWAVAAGAAVVLTPEPMAIASAPVLALAAAPMAMDLVLAAEGLFPIVAPMVIDQRANPVLFDRSTFEDLASIEGDAGGRAIFHKHRVEYLPWHDDRLLLDVDTPEMYKRLVEDDTL